LTSLSDNPGVDLGTLQALVTDCGGHLWMTAQPTGHMMLKIHLPRRVSDRPDSSLPARPATRVESTGHRPSPRTARLPA
jgi:hypothetical protein